MHRLLLLTLLTSFATPAIGQTRRTALDSLGKMLAGFDRSGVFHGVVLIADSGRIVHHSAHGLAHKGYRVPNRPDTKFNLASVGKTFTAVAIGQLVEQGKLRFSDTLGRVLPDYPNRAVADRITISQLLSHRSGLGLYWDKLFAGNWTAVRTSADLLPYFVNDSLEFAPGTRWLYSNTGFAVLAMVVEKVSGEEFTQYVQRHILDKAGMANTGYYALDQDVPNMAVGYFRDEQGTLKNNLFTHTVRGGGAGGGWSTAPDLLRWATALMDGTVVGQTTLDVMMEKQTDAQGAGPGGYGYGFIVEESNGRLLRGHTGGFPGIGTFFFMDPDRRRVGIMMTNEPGPTLRQVWGPVRQYLSAPR